MLPSGAEAWALIGSSTAVLRADFLTDSPSVSKRHSIPTLNVIFVSFKRIGSICVHVLVGLTIPGVALTATVLTISAYAAWNPVSRKHLDRVSFRLLVYALSANLIFGIRITDWTCGLISALMNMSLVFSAGMFLCIAINLPLVLGQKVTGQRMEKYYVLGTSFVSLMTTVIPWASGILGYAYLSRNHVPWLLGTQSFWILLAGIGEVVAFFTIVGYLIAYEFESRYYRPNTQLSSASSPHPGLTILKFRNIVLRIGLYPLVSVLLNILGASLDLHQSKHPEQTDINMALNLAGKTVPND
ncbi:hypothetical protein B0H14DRAFT_2884413, partial [Mycena olivaceomarginata]